MLFGLNRYRILLASRFWNAFLVGSVVLSALVLVAFSMFYQIFPLFGSTYVVFHMLASPGMWVRVKNRTHSSKFRFPQAPSETA